jgi:hypothetical protein
MRSTPGLWNFYIFLVLPSIRNDNLKNHVVPLGRCISDGEAKLYKIDTWAQCYKTFYVHNLRIFVLS